MGRSLYNWINTVPNPNNFEMYAKYGHIHIQTLNLTEQQYALSSVNIQKNFFFVTKLGTEIHTKMRLPFLPLSDPICEYHT